MRILVTGGTGFLGKHLQKAFDQKHSLMLVGSAYDLRFADRADAMLWHCQPDVIVHAAAVCGGILANKNSPADFLTANLNMGINIFEAARKHNVKKVYTLGSVCAYPKHCP
ncbi:MAG TPA: NAD-dependent epimerase/dehydratase family protein, partial [Anaerovoracaceae bacterium]|nr:NAD-dependent epimerase/dehydratase family protein [Anaerovoracaceae bacterium]